MISLIFTWLNRRTPQNYIIKNPYVGSLVLALFCLSFVLLYKPRGTHESRFFSYGLTMAFYTAGSGISVLMAIVIMRNFRFFKDNEDWTILKELTSVAASLVAMGIAIYLLGFILEDPTGRMNVGTLLDSIINSFLIGFIPFAFFTSFNFRYWIYPSGQVEYINNSALQGIADDRILIKINSRLKKDELSFFPDQFIYAVSDSNYVIFHLENEKKIKKVIIRNSISSIEQQLSTVPYITRTHRAFIVNLMKVRSRKGNVLGYRLKLHGVEEEIPVARNNTRTFNKLLKQFS